MYSYSGSLVESVTLAVGLLLLLFGVALLVHLRRRGGLEMALAHMLADSRHRAVFLVGLCISLAALFGIGLSDGLEALVGTSAELTQDIEAVLFILGAGGMMVLMVNALRAPSPSLQEGWILEETAGRVSIAATPLSPGGMGAVPPESTSRRSSRGRN